MCVMVIDEPTSISRYTTLSVQSIKVQYYTPIHDPMSPTQTWIVIPAPALNTIYFTIQSVAYVLNTLKLHPLNMGLIITPEFDCNLVHRDTYRVCCKLLSYNCKLT